jgi:hypothetical protein
LRALAKQSIAPQIGKMDCFVASAQNCFAQCLNGGIAFLEVECNACKTRASLPLDAIRRPLDTPLWKLEPSLKCRSCRNGRYAPPVRMIRLSETREISPYLWVHPDEEDR